VISNGSFKLGHIGLFSTIGSVSDGVMEGASEKVWIGTNV
jgi:hypothetical protein